MLVACGKGLLAMDESNATCNKRFARFGFPRLAVPTAFPYQAEFTDPASWRPRGTGKTTLGLQFLLSAG
jgi:hypothetical protein